MEGFEHIKLKHRRAILLREKYPYYSKNWSNYYEKTRIKSSVLSVVASVATMTFALTPLSAVAQSDTYSTRPIHMSVGYSPSGATDIVARLVGAKMEKQLGQPIVMDNKPGGVSNIAATEAARAKPDGYTLFMATIAQAINPAV